MRTAESADFGCDLNRTPMCFLPDLRPPILGGLFLSAWQDTPAELILAWYVSTSGFDPEASNGLKIE